MQAGRLDRVRPIAEASLAAQLLCELRVQHQHVASTVLSYGTHVKHMCTPPPKKKKLSEDRLTKLAKARARASEVAKEKRERKTMPSDDPIVVVEQDDSDEDQFEGPPGVLFVRRKRAKKPEPVPAAPSISPEMQLLYASMFGSRSF